MMPGVTLKLIQLELGKKIRFFIYDKIKIFPV